MLLFTSCDILVNFKVKVFRRFPEMIAKGGFKNVIEGGMMNYEDDIKVLKDKKVCLLRIRV